MEQLKPSIRVSVLQRGVRQVQVGEQLDYPVGTSLEFSDRTVLGKQDAEIRISPLGWPLNDHSGVSVTIRGMVHPGGDTFFSSDDPVGAEPLGLLRTRREASLVYVFGANPAEGVERQYGKPEPSITVTFLGHPLREIIGDINRRQSEGRPQLEESIRVTSPGDEDRWVKQIIVAGRTFPANFYWGWRGSPLSEIDKVSSFEFSGTGMVLVGIDYLLNARPLNLNISLLLATWADEDGLLRIKQGRLRDIPKRELGQVASNLAKLSVFANNLPQYAQRLHIPRRLQITDSEGGVGQFPLDDVAEILDDCILHPEGPQDRDSRFRWNGNTFLIRSGFDWPEISNQLPAAVVRTEQERLTGILSKAYEEAAQGTPSKI